MAKIDTTTYQRVIINILIGILTVGLDLIHARTISMSVHAINPAQLGHR